MSAVKPLPFLEPRPSIIFVDDDAGNRQAFRSAFRTSMDVYTAAGIAEVWQLLATKQIHVVIADERMPGTRGSELLAQVKERFPKVRRMLITGYADLEAVIEAINNGGVTKYFAKPWVSEQIISAVQQAYTEVTNEAEQLDYTKRLEEANRQLEFALRQRLLS